jgi:AcrR family transcriptional regulator
MTQEVSSTQQSPADIHDRARPDGRRRRADAQRNITSLLEAAKTLFGASGVDAPAREIADAAGVGVGTLYRHFPRRSDLVVAVIRRDIDAQADAARALLDAHRPGDALVIWLDRYAELLATKRGLADALHSGDPAFEQLPDYFWRRLGPELASLLSAAADDGEIRRDIDSVDLLKAIAHLSHSAAEEGTAYSRRMIKLLVDGLRRGPQSSRPG